MKKSNITIIVPFSSRTIVIALYGFSGHIEQLICPCLSLDIKWDILYVLRRQLFNYVSCFIHWKCFKCFSRWKKTTRRCIPPRYREKRKGVGGGTVDIILKKLFITVLSLNLHMKTLSCRDAGCDCNYVGGWWEQLSLIILSLQLHSQHQS